MSEARPSLFDDNAGSVLSAASEWITATLLGDIAIALCVIAVAFVGLMLMTGRLAIQKGVRVAIGCFVLLGAPIIAAGLLGAADQTSVSGTSRSMPVEVTSDSPWALSPPTNYDP